MTISQKQFAVLLLFFLLTVPSSTAEMESPTIKLSNPNSGLQLSSVYLGLSLIHLSFLAYLIPICIKTKPSARRIHMLMAGLILLKSVTLICKYYEELSGTHGSDLFFYISKFISVIHISIVIQLIASGWSFVEPLMQEVDKITLMILIPLQVLANIVDHIVIGENGDTNDWNNLKDILTVIHLITCCVMFFHVLSLMSSFTTDGMAGRNENLYQFRQFISMVMIYMFFMRAARLVRNNGHVELNAIDDDNQINSIVVLEMFSLFFYSSLFDLFRKHIIHVDQDE